MNRDTRTMIVVLVAVLTGAAAAYAVRQYVRARPIQQAAVAVTNVVVAARPLPVGTRLAAADVKVVAWPVDAQIPGAFNQMDPVVNRGLVQAVDTNEPITNGKLAAVDAGSGLSPTIPDGMRAISVQVNEVIGVAGFVTPGTHVDVLGTFKQGSDGDTRVVVNNEQVLTAGTHLDPDKSGAGAMPSSVVTLLLTPADAEKVVLASNSGQIMLALRNPLDTTSADTTGTRSAELLGAPVVTPAPVVATPRPSRPKVAEPPPPPPAPPKPYTVETIRAAKRAEEAVREP